MKNHLLSIFFERNRFIQCFVILTMIICSVAQAQALPGITPKSIFNSSLEDTFDEVRFKYITLPTNGTVISTPDRKEVIWQIDNMEPDDILMAKAMAVPEYSDLFAIGIQMNSMKIDYSLRLFSPKTNNVLEVSFIDHPNKGPLLEIDTWGDYGYCKQTFFVPDVEEVGQLELGVDAGIVSLKLGDTLYNITRFNVLGFGVSTGGDWSIEVTIGRNSNSIEEGEVSVRLITNSMEGLTLPTSKWLSNPYS